MWFLWLAATAHASTDYELTFHARFLPEEDAVEATILVRQQTPGLTLVDLNAPESRFTDFEGDGDVDRDDDRVIWKVPGKGGELRYRTVVDHKRSGSYDARMTDDWAILRLDDLFPPARTRSSSGARASTRLALEGPGSWNFETPYGPVTSEGVSINSRGRRFDRPVGWLAAGELGIRRTSIADRHIVIAGPKDQGFRRMDLLVFLNWTLPHLVRVAPSLPDRLLIVGGSQSMWRGGLSGPGSLYVHPDRPLVSGNATSTFLHELIHVATTDTSADGDDWIVEGIAEYYSLLLLLRSGGISGTRFQGTLEDLRDWMVKDRGKLSDPSTGADTARAVLLFRDLDVELAAAGARLDDVITKLLAGRMDRRRLQTLTEAELGRPSKVLADADMPAID
jgi:hypothetical protein